MFNTRTKTVIFVLLLTFSASQIVSAEVKVYQYDGKLPFVQMMLNMMVAMGILDRLPANGAYGGYSGNPLSRWSNLSNPYARALAMRGFSPTTSLSSWQYPYGQGSYSNNPFTRSPWLSSPWSQSTAGGASPASPVWGSPGWGVLPMESYSLNNYAWNDYNTYGAPAYSPYWSSQEINGWVNEPWESSQWNPRAEAVVPAPQQQSPPPLVQNFNYNAPAKTLADDTPNKQANKQSPLSKLAQPGLAQAGAPTRPSSGRAVRSPEKQPPLPKRVRQRSCVTEFCGLKKPDLDGLWLAQNGEMLGVKNHRYLWSDNSSRYLTGQLKIQNEYLLANIDGHESLMRFKYKLAGNHLLTMQPDGVIREFTRMSGNQYNHPYQRRYYQ